ncbi:MAG: hypothetical protein JO264_20365 [Acidisphaera sp.]|nr:hypothetical protein [Acidisphaera sp.]
MKTALLTLTVLAGLAGFGALPTASAATAVPAPTVQQSTAVQSVGYYHCDWRCRRHREWMWRHHH